jgi:hypothetical protein
MVTDNHYDYLRAYWVKFVKAINLPNAEWVNDGMISAHGDKGYGYRSMWEEAGIPFGRGMLIYLLSYCSPYHKTVRETANGWVKPDQWVISMYPQFKEIMEKLEGEDPCT